MATRKTAAAAAEEIKAVETNIVETESVESKAAKEAVKEEAPKAKKTAAKKTAAAKTTAEKKAAAPKKTAARKTAAKKAEMQASVVIQYAGREILAKDVLAAAARSFQEAHEGVEIRTIEVYVKPEENAAYYVVNGEGSDDYKVEL